MKRDELIHFIGEGPILFDGAMGSNLYLAGMPRGVSSEAWILEHPEVVLKLQKDYVEAGSQMVLAPTFMANRLSLGYMGLSHEVSRFNREIVPITKEAVAGKALVAGDMTTTGMRVEPLGDLSEKELFDAYKEQAEALNESGVDLIVGETLIYKEEALILIDAVKSVCDLAIGITFTVNEKGDLPFGGNVYDAVGEVEKAGAAMAGINCSMGPDKALDVVSKICSLVSIPVVAKLNAGVPTFDAEGRAIYGMDAESFAKDMKRLSEAGARVVGGCCGTTPAFIRALSDILS